MTPERRARAEAWLAAMDATGIPYHHLDEPGVLPLIAGFLRSTRQESRHEEDDRRLRLVDD